MTLLLSLLDDELNLIEDIEYLIYLGGDFNWYVIGACVVNKNGPINDNGPNWLNRELNRDLGRGSMRWNLQRNL